MPPRDDAPDGPTEEYLSPCCTSVLSITESHFWSDIGSPPNGGSQAARASGWSGVVEGPPLHMS
jgi:hypothetical protein